MYRKVDKREDSKSSHHKEMNIFGGNYLIQWMLTNLTVAIILLYIYMSSNYADTLNLYTELCANYISIKQKQKKLNLRWVPTFGAQGSSPGKGPGRWDGGFRPVRSQALVHSSSPAGCPAAKVTREEGKSTAPDARTAEHPLSSFAEATCLSFVPGNLAAPLSSVEGATHPGSHPSTGQSPGCSLASICVLSAS